MRRLIPVLCLLLLLPACGRKVQNAPAQDVPVQEVPAAEASAPSPEEADGKGAAAEEMVFGTWEEMDPEADDSFSILGAPEDLPETESANSFGSLSVPTCIAEFDGRWYLVDCYHNQLISSESLEKPIWEWNVVQSGLSYPHTVAGDGAVFLLDDTEKNRVLVFEGTEESPRVTQYFEGVGSRPHCCLYDEERRCFYVLSSGTGEVYRYVRQTDEAGRNRLSLSGILSVPRLSDTYVRSIALEDGDLWFVSGISASGLDPVIVRLDPDDPADAEAFPVPDCYAGQACMKKLWGWWYITVSTDRAGSQDAATILRVRDLEDLQAGTEEILYERYFAGGGTPYFLTQIGEDAYLTEHRLNDHALWRFRADAAGDGTIGSVESIY